MAVQNPIKQLAIKIDNAIWDAKDESTETFKKLISNDETHMDKHILSDKKSIYDKHAKEQTDQKDCLNEMLCLHKKYMGAFTDKERPYDLIANVISDNAHMIAESIIKHKDDIRIIIDTEYVNQCFGQSSQKIGCGFIQQNNGQIVPFTANVATIIFRVDKNPSPDSLGFHLLTAYPGQRCVEWMDDPVTDNMKKCKSTYTQSLLEQTKYYNRPTTSVTERMYLRAATDHNLELPPNIKIGYDKRMDTCYVSLDITRPNDTIETNIRYDFNQIHPSKKVKSVYCRDKMDKSSKFEKIPTPQLLHTQNNDIETLRKITQYICDKYGFHSNSPNPQEKIKQNRKGNSHEQSL